MSTPSLGRSRTALRNELTFDAVSKNRHEATYQEVAGRYGGPMSKHPVVSVKGHPEVVWVRPDMGVGSVANSVALGSGATPQKFPWHEVRRSLLRGYLPIVESRWYRPPLEYRQLAFAVLLGARRVCTGREKQLAMVKISITNTDPTRDCDATLWAFIPANVAVKGVPPFPYNTYDLFEVTGNLPNPSGQPVHCDDETIRSGEFLLGRHFEDEGVETSLYANALHFGMALLPGAAKSIYLMIPTHYSGLSVEEMDALSQLDFHSALDQRIQDLEDFLKRGTQISVPENVVNNIYRAQILYDQAQVLQAADRDYCLPVQGFQGVWPWEAMKLTTGFDAIGLHDDARKCLEYFLKIQDRFHPQGDFKSTEGVFGGTICFEESGWEHDSESSLYGQLAKLNAGKEKEFPNWMNGTGAMLYAFGIHYFYVQDRQWLARVAPALLRACNWIITERQQTKQTDAQGQKVLHFGLLPMGRAYDTADEAIQQLVREGALESGQLHEGQFPGNTYYPCWTDSYSSQGLSCVAEALADIGHPEADRLVREAAEYRRDLLEVLRRTRDIDPHHAPYPERLNRPPAWAEFGTGALALVDTGFLSPHDPAFEQLEGYMKLKWNRDIVGLTGGLEKDGDPHGADVFYVNFSEDIWHRAWLLRGETEKAILSFYSMLAYGVDKDTLGSVERFHLKDQRYAPFFMDTSASARFCGLIFQTLLLAEGDTLHLLAGVPRRWLEAGKRIEVRGGLTPLAKLDFTVTSHAKDGKIVLEWKIQELRPSLKRIRIRMPHPARQPIQAVLLDGKALGDLDRQQESLEIPPAIGRHEMVFIY